MVMIEMGRFKGVEVTCPNGCFQMVMKVRADSDVDVNRFEQVAETCPDCGAGTELGKEVGWSADISD